MQKDRPHEYQVQKKIKEFVKHVTYCGHRSLVRCEWQQFLLEAHELSHCDPL
jgi:hypothetical protein